VCGVVRRASPGEGRVTGDKAGGNGERIDRGVAGVTVCRGRSFETLDDGEASLMDVAAGDSFVAERSGDRNRPVEVISVRGAERRNGQAGLREARGVCGVRMHDRADGRELAIEQRVRVEIGGRSKVAFDDLAVEVGDDHVARAELGVVDAGGLDDDEALVAVDARGVAEGVKHKAATNEFEVGLEDLFTKLFEQHGESLEFISQLLYRTITAMG
jgi:hypothetical protein